jgi:hypothetical protein
MKTVRLALLAAAAAATLAGAGTALAQRQEQASINQVGQSLKNSEGIWTLSKDGSTRDGYAVRLNGHDVGYAVTLTMDRNGLPMATHADGSRWVWTGSTFRRQE